MHHALGSGKETDQMVFPMNLVFSSQIPTLKNPPPFHLSINPHHSLSSSFHSLTPCSPLTVSSSSSSFRSSHSSMAGDVAAASPSSYEDALNSLSSLITRRVRGDGANRGVQFDLMRDYLRMLELEDPISKLKVIHVAGTKGKGSTCSFTESILRNCGLRTGLFTSPHLIDVRERFRLDGVEISEEKFLEYFWWCWNRLQEKVDDNVPMPPYFRFLALLGFKIFSAEQVDVAILEVGLGGKYDATNVVQAPVVCGISSLGYDHMEILGNTLGEIAGEKAGIFKVTVPAFTVPQPEEAMHVLEDKASRLGISLQVAPSLDISLLKGLKLGLDGEHQYLNAGLAISLCRTWLKRTGHLESMYVDDSSTLPEKFIKGLAKTRLPGRAQIVQDPIVSTESQIDFNLGGLTFYLEGAHSPESMEVCAKWFSRVIKKNNEQLHSMKDQIASDLDAKNILLFNCMSVRDPERLLPRLVNVCADNGVYFDKALFVPNQSLYHKVGSNALPANDSPQVDVSWQQKLQRVWQNLVHGDRDLRIHTGIADNKTIGSILEQNKNADSCCHENSSVFHSLPSAIKWLRETAQQNRTVRFQVLVTGSLHLVGDVLRLIKK